MSDGVDTTSGRALSDSKRIAMVLVMVKKDRLLHSLESAYHKKVLAVRCLFSA